MSNGQKSPMWQLIEYLEGLAHPSSSTNVPARTTVQQATYRKIKQKAIELLEVEQALSTAPPTTMSKDDLFLIIEQCNKDPKIVEILKTAVEAYTLSIPPQEPEAKAIADDAFEAGMEYEWSKHNGSAPFNTPNKEQYLSQIKK